MNFRVHELEIAQQDIRTIFDWLLERSTDGAAAWIDAYEVAVAKLRDRAANYGPALESEELGVDLRQSLFKTRRGRVYRIVFRIDKADVTILRVRGPGQAPLAADN